MLLGFVPMVQTRTDLSRVIVSAVQRLQKQAKGNAADVRAEKHLQFRKCSRLRQPRAGPQLRGLSRAGSGLRTDANTR